jgi:hypothetical protein
MADLRAWLEGLRDRTTPNGVADPARLKVAGQDPLPKGAVYGAHAVTVTGGTLDGWDLGGRGLVIRGRASLANILSRGVTGVGKSCAIEIGLSGDVDWAENIEFAGTFGAGGKPSAVVNARSAGSGAGFRAGRLRRLRRSRFEGFPADHMKLHGVPDGGQVIEECYFGPQWAPAGSKAHADAFTTVAAQGRVHIRHCLVDWTDAGRPAGLNNIFRIVRNAGTDAPLDHVRIEENLCYFGPVPAFPVQVQAGPGFAGPVEFIGNWIGAKIAASGARAYWHPSTDGTVARWAGNRDTGTGQDLQGPRGAKAG